MNVYWWFLRVTLVVGLGFFPNNFGPMVGTREDHLLFCEFRWYDDSTWRWRGHLNTTCCNWSCFNFLWSRVVGIQKPSLDCPHTPCISCTPHMPYTSCTPHNPCSFPHILCTFIYSQVVETQEPSWLSSCERCKGCERCKRCEGVRGAGGVRVARGIDRSFSFF